MSINIQIKQILEGIGCTTGATIGISMMDEQAQDKVNFLKAAGFKSELLISSQSAITEAGRTQFNESAIEDILTELERLTKGEG